MTKSYDGPRLPAKQLAILAVARFAEPLAMTSVFPYLPEMVASFGVVEDDVPFWAGLTGAVFSLSQSITAVPWGRASDRFGRKPIILVGLVCTMLCFLVWGVSTSLAMAITVRAIQGGSNGNVGIIRTMVAEMVPERELQPRAFSIMPLVWSIGSIFGPAFGGLFANPAKQFPSVFGDSPFFVHYPFALPNMLGSIVFLISVATGGLFLKETLASKRDQRDWGLVLGEKLTKPFKKRSQRNSRRYSFQDDEASAPLLQAETGRRERRQAADTKTEKPAPPSLKHVFTRQSVITLVSYTFLALHSVAYDQVLPVFLHFSRQQHDGSNTQLPFIFSGGFGLDSGRIGTINMIYGIFCGLIQFILFPPLCARFGTLTCFRACAVIFPIAYLLTPFTVLIEDTTMRYVALFAVLVLKAAAVIIGFPCTTILLTNSARSLHVLASLNGFATTFSALGRAAGPAMTGAAFSWGVKRGVVSVPYWILAAVAVLGAVPAWWIVEGEGPSREPTVLDGGDDDDDAAEDSDATDVPTGPTEQSTRPKSIARSALSPAPNPFDPLEDDATSHEPNAGDDLPLVGSWKSSQGTASFGSRTTYGAIGQRLGLKAANTK